jgi:uncharacterized protein YhaN
MSSILPFRGFCRLTPGNYQIVLYQPEQKSIKVTEVENMRSFMRGLLQETRREKTVILWFTVTHYFFF